LTFTYKERTRLSSSPSEGLFSGIFARGAAAEAVSDRAWLQAMLDVEAALARACSARGLISADAADAIAAVCDGEGFDVQQLGRAAAGGGNPAIALVQALRGRVGEPFAEHVHRGATSQDVLDTAAMLVARDALRAIRADARAVIGACAELVERHRDTHMLGRTLLQPAMATTFGLKAAGWLTGVNEADDALAHTERRLALQLGGPVGTLAGYGAEGTAVAESLASELGLQSPTLPWHANRVRVVELAGALALLCGALAKIARDVTLLAQDEVAEAREHGGEGDGVSSSMAHKRNPVAAVSTIACAQRVPGLLSTLATAMAGEHERAAGAWQSEWETLSAALRLAGSASSWAATMLDRLEVDSERMQINLERAVAEHGLIVDVGMAGELCDRVLSLLHAEGEIQ
jgi:3-carboxy-cis,cis-muconate cycloisomerase